MRELSNKGDLGFCERYPEGINYNLMQHNKPINTPQKSLRSYLDVLRSSPHKRKSIFSRDRTPSTAKTLRSKDPLKTQPRTKTEPIQHRTTEDLANQMGELLNMIKIKYNLYVKADEDNVRLKKENAFLKEELAIVRKEIARNREDQEFIRLKKENEMYEEKFGKAKRQLKELKRIYKGDDHITLGLDQLLQSLTVDFTD